MGRVVDGFVVFAIIGAPLAASVGWLAAKRLTENKSRYVTAAVAGGLMFILASDVIGQPLRDELRQLEVSVEDAGTFNDGAEWATEFCMSREVREEWQGNCIAAFEDYRDRVVENEWRAEQAQREDCPPGYC